MEFTKHQRAVLAKAISTWGHRQQINKAIEELSELIQALAKWQNREVQGPGFEGYCNMAPIHEEMGDVTVMMEQLKQIFGRDTMEKFAANKIERLEGFLK